jgi:hypothetical protein
LAHIKCTTPGGNIDNTNFIKIQNFLNFVQNNTWEAEQEDLEFKAVLGYTLRPCFKKQTNTNKKTSRKVKKKKCF